ncbi:MAG: trypsin-like peptidase domain-containing protein [Armatimonadetes bacterium]|nr:trypsin-like peptidase domain-containing protein [Armatimonadota bacterium]
MRKVIQSLLFIVIGIIIGVGTLHWLQNSYGILSTNQAKAALIRILDHPPKEPNIGRNPIVAAVAKIEPAVVNIDTVGEAQSTTMFFGQAVPGPLEIMEGKGSGVIISPNGYVVTNNHVIANTDIIRVTTPSGKKYDGRVVGSDPQADIALVKINGKNLPYARLGDSSKLMVGEWAIAIGDPLGVGTTVTVGVVSATNRHNLRIDQNHILRDAIQTDAAINRGNSGGALANINGQLIGINTAIVSEGGGGNIGIGFAIPINTVRSVLRTLIQKSRKLPPLAQKPFLGIQFSPVDPSISQQLQIPPGVGAWVQVVLPSTPAAAAGLVDNDIILKIDGKAVHSIDLIRQVLNSKKVGDNVVLTVITPEGLRKNITVKLGAQPAAMQSH